MKLHDVINKCIDFREVLGASEIASDINSSFVVHDIEDIDKDIGFLKELISYTEKDYGIEKIRDMLPDWLDELEKEKIRIKQGRRRIKMTYSKEKKVEDRKPTWG